MAAVTAATVALALMGPADAAERAACAQRPSAGVAGERLALLSRGFNLTSWMSGEATRRPDQAALAGLRARGFSHVRLPVAAERLLTVFGSRDGVARQLAELDTAVDTLIRLGFGVSLDLHPGDRFGRLHASDPSRGFELLEPLWQTLGRRYAGRSPDRLFLEVLNEPTIAPALWNEQGPRLVQAIRREAPNHTIIYGPADFQQIGALAELVPLGDRNLVYAAHFYEPMVFTHQGLDWSKNDPLRFLDGVPFPARSTDPAVVWLLDSLARRGHDDASALLKSQLREPWTEDRIAGVLARAAGWAARHGRPVILNEFGVLAWKAAPADRARWIAAVRRAAEAHCIGWAHWDYADGFGFVHRVAEREIPDEAIVQALIGDGAASRARPNVRAQ